MEGDQKMGEGDQKMGEGDEKMLQGENAQLAYTVRHYLDKPAREITLASIKGVWHLRQNDAAKELGISKSLLKKACHKLRVGKWPKRRSKFMQTIVKRKNTNAFSVSEMMNMLPEQVSWQPDKHLQDKHVQDKHVPDLQNISTQLGMPHLRL
jgi:hypothetical protein